MKRVLGTVWKLLTSLEVAVILILLLTAFQVVGALIPQDMGEEFYLKAWEKGTYETLRDLGILNLFRSPVFVVPALLLGLNILCCSIDILRQFFPKGITARFTVSALYHLAMLAMFVGFFATFLFAYGGELTIKPGEAVRVPLNKGDTHWAALAPRLGLEAPRNEESSYELRLKSFETTYVEKEGRTFVKDWISDLEVLEGGEVVKAKRIEVNDPLVYGGVKFYQAFFDQKIKFSVDGEEQELGMGEPLAVGEEMLMVSTVKGGTMLADDGPRPLGPYVELKEMPKDKWHRLAKDIRPGTRLDLGAPTEVKGHDVTFLSYEESSGLTYKRDAAVKYLWILWIAFTVLIAVRVYLQESTLLWFRKSPPA
ncbi:MAG: cytochrome c biogenesis protein ResB [Candidatus Coatesbacteria bacterium]|nr:MAG: cytochrome c biogenesis protein ResB [Candidatus Coatesbacteria bacterium]